MPFPYISSAFTSSSTSTKRDIESPPTGQSPSSGPFTSSIKDDQHSSHPIADSSPAPGRAERRSNGYIVFERRDRASPYLAGDGAAECMGEGDRLKGLEGVVAAVVDAVDSIGHEDDYSNNNPFTPTPTRSNISISNRHHKRASPSVLTPAMADFAAQYPLTTVAAIGAIGSGVLIGSAALTALTIRTLSRAFSRSAPSSAPLGRPLQSSAIIPRPDPILSDIEALTAKQGEILHQMAEWQKTMEPLIRSNEAGKAASAKAIKEARAKIGDVPIAGSLGEARLGQVIRQAMEDVLAAQNDRSLQPDAGDGERAGSSAVESVPNSPMMDSLDRLESITLGIMDEIRLLRESKGPNDPSPAIEDNGEGVMSLNQLTDMINGYEASIQQDEQVGEGTNSAAEDLVSQEIICPSRPGKKGRKPKPATEAISTGSTNTGTEEAQEELQQEWQFERAVLGPDAAMDDSLEVVAAEVRKAGKSKKKKSKAAVPVPEDQYTVEGAASAKAENSPSIGQERAVDMGDAAPSGNGAELGMDDFAAKNRSQAREAEPARQRKPTQLPPSETVGNGQKQDAGEFTSPIDSGHWSFQLQSRPPTRSSGWHDIGIVLQGRGGVAGVAEFEDYWGSFVSSGTSTRYVDARVFFNPEPDMIHLDGGIWRCGREGREYVIRERIA